MNEENEDFNIEEELGELPGYIQSIINDCSTFDKKDFPNEAKENQNKNSVNEDKKTNINDISIKENKNLHSTNNISDDKNNNMNNNNKDILNDEENFFFDDDKENDYNIENIFNSKNDFFNPKASDKETNLENNKKDESKENINKIFENQNKNNDNNDLGIKLYCVQENNLLNIKRSLRLQSILQNNMAGYQNNTYECSICFRRIQNYGLLSNCDDVFCYDCIKQWRTEAISKNKRVMFRRCPICNCESPMLLKSKNYVSGEEKKKKFYELKQGKKNSQSNQ